MVLIVNIARVLVHQVLYLVLLVEHQHQRDDGELAAGTRCKVPLATPCIGIDGRNELLRVAAFYSLARPCIHLAGILIRRIGEKSLLITNRFSSVKYGFSAAAIRFSLL